MCFKNAGLRFASRLYFIDTGLVCEESGLSVVETSFGVEKSSLGVGDAGMSALDILDDLVRGVDLGLLESFRASGKELDARRDFVGLTKSLVDSGLGGFDAFLDADNTVVESRHDFVVGGVDLFGGFVNTGVERVNSCVEATHGGLDLAVVARNRVEGLCSTCRTCVPDVVDALR